LKLKEVAERLNCRLDGDGEVEIRRVAGIERAGEGDLTFIAHEKYVSKLAHTAASAVLVTEQVARGKHAAGPSTSLLITTDPYLAFAHAVSMFTEAPAPPVGIDHTSRVAPDAVLGEGVAIGPFVSVGPGAAIGARTVIHAHAAIGAGARLGEDCRIHPQVSIRDRVVLGNRVIVQDGAVIGSDGFGFARQPDGTHLKIPQHAGVVIEDDVEIGANTAIDRPAIGETRIGAGTKIDNLVQIGHGVAVGRRVLFAAQVGIGGSCTIEDDVILAGQVGVANHVRLGKGVVATAQSGIPNSVEAGEQVSGYPAIPNRDWLKSAAVYRQLPVLKKRVADLEQRLAELEEKLTECLKPSGR
jgi:UDP-3-O-[3-hydroxymyristoyl] glucosamine N-acyltransferase